MGFADSAKSNGIVFFEGSFKDALAQSQQTKKPVFIYVYASWCGTCKQLKKNFKDEAVGNYYNANFIPFAIDGEKPEGVSIMKRYNIKSYPTLLIVDSNAKQLARTTGFMKPYILINFGRRVVPQ
jgi:thiol:disulfide interchange protein